MTDADHYTHRYLELIEALRDLPELPSPSVLHSLASAAKFPIDSEEGKRIQRERGLDAVPPVHECEMGAGYWSRVIRPAALRSSPGVDFAEIGGNILVIHPDMPPHIFDKRTGSMIRLEAE